MKDKSEIISHFILCLIIICILYNGITYNSKPIIVKTNNISPTKEVVSSTKEISEFNPLINRNTDTTKFSLIIYSDTVKKITHNIRKEIPMDTITIRDTNSIRENIIGGDIIVPSVIKDTTQHNFKLIQ